MSELTKTKNYMGIFWFLLAILLFIGLVIHKPEIDTTTYTALWLTEMITFLVIGIYFVKPTSTTAMGAAIVSLVWLINQIACWYGYGTYGGTYTIGEYGGTGIYIATALINSLVFAFVLWQNTASRERRLAIPTTSKDHKTYGMIAMCLMLIFAIWKIWLDIQYGAFTGTTWAFSGFLWGFGILLMTLASLTVIFEAKEVASIATIIAIAGFAISAYASLAYGLALRLLGVG